jgi:hypothetical protein
VTGPEYVAVTQLQADAFITLDPGSLPPRRIS